MEAAKEGSVTTVADVIAGALVRHGIEFVLGQSNPTALMLALERRGVRQVLYRTENAAGAMADAFARVSHQIAVMTVQNGPAATLAVAPMAEAMKVSIPMLVLAQDVPLANLDRNAFQEFDHAALFASVSKFTRRIDDPSRAVDMVDLAITVATSGRPGPVVLLLPKDVLTMPAGAPLAPRSKKLGRFPLDRPRPEADQVTRAAALLAGARSPLIMAGGGVHVSGAADALVRLAEIGRIPVATTNMGKGSIAETHPLSVGVAANLTGRLGPAYHLRPLIEDADVVLLVGTRTNENGTDSWTLTSPQATYIHIDVDPLEVGRNYESERLLGDARSALEDLADSLGVHDLSIRTAAYEEIVDTIARARQQRSDDLTDLHGSTTTPIAPERLLRELDMLLGPDDIVVADASYSSVWVTSYLTAKRTGARFILPRGLGGLGWGLPLAMGAKLAAPNARVVTIVGDGGFAHVWSELETALREDIPVCVIVLNNSELAFQRHAETMWYGEATKGGIEFLATDHAAIARAIGAEGMTVSDPSDIAAALAWGLSHDRPTVIDVITDPHAKAPLRAWDLAQAAAETASVGVGDS